VHNVGNKTECNNMHGERIKTIWKVWLHVYIVKAC